MNFDHIDQMVRRANPVPDPNALESAIATVSMINQNGTSQMQTQTLVEDPHTKDRPRRGWRIVVGAGVAAMAVVAAVFVLNAQDEDWAEPAAPPTTVAPVVPTTIAPVVTPPVGSSPLGLELVGLDGSTSNLGLPTDAWMADLSADGSSIVFITASTEIGDCGSCTRRARLAVVEVSSGDGRIGHVASNYYFDIRQPTWSPDGTKLAFQGDHRGSLDIYVADLTVWSDPASESYFGYQGFGTFVVPAEAVVRLTTDPGVDQFPAWSLDGTVIYYDNLGTGTESSGMADTGEIWSVPASGGEPTRLTHNDWPDMQPDVGPDGRVAYWSGGEIWTMAPDGSAQQHLSTVPWDLGWNPRWSPDGTKLALLRYEPRSPRAVFESNPIHETALPSMDVVVVDVATGEVTDLGVQVASFYNPVSWTPDGNSLLVTRYR